MLRTGCNTRPAEKFASAASIAAISGSQRSTPRTAASSRCMTIGNLRCEHYLTGVPMPVDAPRPLAQAVARGAFLNTVRKDMSHEADVVPPDAVYRAAGRFPRKEPVGMGRHSFLAVRPAAGASHVQRLY